MDSETAHRYLKLVLRWWWLLVLSVAVPAAISYYLSSQEPELYQAKATIIVGRSVFQETNPDRREIDLSNTLAAAYAELLRRRAVLEPVVERLGLDRTPERLASQIGTNIRSGAQLLEITVTDTDPQAAALIANALADELIRRSPTSEENTPEREQFLEDQLEEIEAKIKTVESEINELTASLAELTSAAEIQEAQEKIEALEQVESRYQATYAQLLSVSRTESPNELALFEQAVAPERPVPSRTMLIVGVAGAAGLALAAGAILLSEYLDTSLQWAEDSQSFLDVAVLATVPQASNDDLLPANDPFSPIAEGVRAIRAGLHLLQPEGMFRTLLLTSPGGSEGKSFIVANLAAVLAAAGHRVIVVDGDMRRPSLHEVFDQPNIVGLADILSYHRFNSDDQATAIPLQVTDVENLWLLSSGRPPADPSRLLTSSRFSSLLATLEKHADVILIDSPPVLGPPDATIIATQAEGTILVLSSGLTSNNSARQAKDLLLAQKGVHLLGVVVNRVRIQGSYHYYCRTFEQEGKAPWWERWAGDGSTSHMTLAEAASRLGISRRQARRWCRGGRLPADRKMLLWWQVDYEGVNQLIEQTLTTAGEQADAPSDGSAWKAK